MVGGGGGGGVQIFSLWWEGHWLLMSSLPHLPLPRHHDYHYSLIDELIVMFAYFLHLAQLCFDIFHKNASCAVKREMRFNKYGIKRCRKSCFLRTCSLSFHLHFNFYKRWFSKCKLFFDSHGRCQFKIICTCSKSLIITCFSTTGLANAIMQAMSYNVFRSF